VIARGIARRKIFPGDTDLKRLLNRLGELLDETQTRCFSWALIPNHFHLLLQTGSVPIANVMRRLLTGYAITFNKRHRRWGHLFQNRYKSILCQEEPYLLELVRYIHLNPVRANLVCNLEDLDKYPHGGHFVLMGKRAYDWQETEYVLGLFGDRVAGAREEYRAFVEKGLAQGNRQDLVGGGLIRSMGGWSEVKTLRKEKAYLKGDERILGDSDLVDAVLEKGDEQLERKCKLAVSGMDLDGVACRVAELLEMTVDEVWSSGKYPQIVKARSLLCYWAVKELGMSKESLSRRLRISPPAVSKSVIRGEHVAQNNAFTLLDK
jgi:REP element-mobilizing transposase RayT